MAHQRKSQMANKLAAMLASRKRGPTSYTLADGRPIRSPEEDSLPARKRKRLAKAGWDYMGGPGKRGKWVPPGFTPKTPKVPSRPA